jgi:heterodisulfide reductase subunit B
MSTEQYAYEISVRETMPLLDVELVDVQGFSCCGEPLKSVNQLMALFLSARNLALAEKHGLSIFAPCAMCHLALSECKNVLDKNPELKKRINDTLASEELSYSGNCKIVHTIDLLHDHIGIDEITKHVKKPLKGVKLATHYGCHALRPSEIGRPDHSEHPIKMEAILTALGAETAEYPEKLDCCGGLLQINLDESALTKAGQKLKAVQERGFNGLVDVCPWCHKMLDARQTKAGETVATKVELPVFYLPQLVGLAMGIKKEKLGLELNRSPVDKIQL